jgi:glycosyltransferase involved in cell wall biosynthesis
VKTAVSILYPTDPCYPKVGGVAVLIKGFIKYAPDDFDIEYYGTSSDPKERPIKKWTPLTVEGRNIRFLPVLYERDENVKTRIPLTLRFTAALMTFRADHSGRVLFFNTIEPCVLFTRAKNPQVLIIHNDIEKQMTKGQGEMLWSKMPAVYFKFEKWIMAGMDRVYSESMNTIRFYQKRYAPKKEKFAFLPTWVDDGIFCPSRETKQVIRRRLAAFMPGIPETARWILFTGRLQKQKSPVRLVEAFAEYRKINPDSALVLVGGGNMQPEVERRASELGVDQSVFIVPGQQQAVLVDYYRAADAFLLTSNYEGMSVSVLESLACGLPVVMTEAGEARRVVRARFSGEVVEGFAPEAIALGLDTVLKNPGVYTVSNCLEAVSEYTAKRVLAPLYDAMRELYREKCV